ncbi:MAG: formylglycine-generating enzyme family protein [Candidatus Thiodiazotropha taylori]|nr:formylglycine-generating enzyme family protein [Candidatus Thiodiazotropha taylori]
MNFLKLFMLCMLLGMIAAMPIQAEPIPRVTNAEIAQEGGDIVLHYRLDDPVGQGAEVIFEVSTDQGKSWKIPNGISGDHGRGITAGGGKRIRWDIYRDYPRGLRQQVEFRVETRSERELIPTLTVDVTPDDARIRILNIGPKYQPGMALKPGKYHVEVSKGGYKRHRQWIELSGGNETFPVRLEKSPARKSYEPEMIRIPSGHFRMGDQFGEGDSDEKPVHEVRISGFELGKYEVTQAQWQAVMGSNPSKFTGCQNCPVELVSWDDIQVYLRKLNQITGRRYRLPTESEWEYACRSGGKQEKYCGGSNLSSLAWYESNDKTHPVGQKEPNGLGLYDMSGNVWEWTQDCWNDSYSGAPQDGSAWRDGDCSRAVLRGRSWSPRPTYVRSADRSRAPRDTRFTNYGFRLARDL